LEDDVTIFIHSAASVKYAHFDYSWLVIWSIAILAVGAGSYWSGFIRHNLMYSYTFYLNARHRVHLRAYLFNSQNKNRIAAQLAEGNVNLSEESKVIMKEKVSLTFNPINVAVLVLINIVVLVLLYLFLLYSSEFVFNCKILLHTFIEGINI
jgi:hypothetical protein